MKYIDMENWKRRRHYEFFKQFDYPHFNICVDVDITKFRKYIKENNKPFFLSVVYMTIKAANGIKEFRYRIRDNKVIEHDVIHPGFTVMGKDDVFSFCGSDYNEDFEIFRQGAQREIDKRQEEIEIGNEAYGDDLIYMTSLPWISFNSMSHPIHMSPADSVPRIAWGKYSEENGKIKMPISIQAHHSLMDGMHAGKYIELLQEMLDNAEKHL